MFCAVAGRAGKNEKRGDTQALKNMCVKQDTHSRKFGRGKEGKRKKEKGWS